MEISERSKAEKYLLAANALLLIRLIFVGRSRLKEKEELGEYLETDSRDYASYERLFNVLTGTGLLDHRIESMIAFTPKSFAEAISPQINPSEDVARVTFRDVPFSPDELMVIEASNGGALSELEWLMPVLAWQPGAVVNAARTVVREYIVRLHLRESTSTPRAENDGSTDKKAAREAKAVSVLELLHGRLSRRPRKKEVLVVLSNFVGTKAAALRVWERSDIPKWKMQGRPGNQELLNRSSFELEFENDFQKYPPPKK